MVPRGKGVIDRDGIRYGEVARDGDSGERDGSGGAGQGCKGLGEGGVGAEKVALGMGTLV